MLFLMVKNVGSVEKICENMKDDDEFEMLLGEIPHATSLNLHHVHENDDHHVHGHGSHKMDGMMLGMYDDDPLNHYKHTCASPVSGFSLQSDGSSSSLFSAAHSLSDNGSPTPPPLEDLKSHALSGAGNPHCLSGLLLDSKLPNSSFGKMSNENMVDSLNILSRNLGKMYITEEQEDFSNRFRFCDRGSSEPNPINVKRYGDYDNYRNVFPDYPLFQSSVPTSPINFNSELRFQHEHRLSNLLSSRYPLGHADGLSSQSNYGISSQYHRGIPLPNLATPVIRPSSVADTLFYAQQNGINLIEEMGAFNSPVMPQFANPPMLNGRMRASSNTRVPQGVVEAFNGEDSLIIQGEGLNYVMNRRSRGRNNKGSLHEIGLGRPREKRTQLDNAPQIAGMYESGRNERMNCPLSLPLKCNTLAEAQGYIYLIAKDQNGCRFLQRMFDEGTPQELMIIFSEIIDHVVELMVNPFGNYLMQKLLEVCNEEQRMQILLMVTLKPGELVRISLNTHGTRVVQKLIETLKTSHQISLVISALEPGFLDLIRDLNGNHVVQRCLQCLSNEDNKFIFMAAAKNCLDIATHQHGCCVLQRCISYSTGEHRDNLVAEISENGLLLAQDAFGNYVVQFILELKIPYATSKLISQFEGNFVHLSTQKFSSHVVEKCLVVLDDSVRSIIIQELVSATHFEQLLQDPHANYVVQKALRVSEGPPHNLLVNAIESHKAISRNSPYSKKIFSQKLLKK